MKISRLLLAILLCAAPLWTSQAQTDYPTRPVRFLVPWPAGGLNDIIARSFNDKVSQSLGKQVITDFKAGAALAAQFKGVLELEAKLLEPFSAT